MTKHRTTRLHVTLEVVMHAHEGDVVNVDELMDAVMDYVDEHSDDMQKEIMGRQENGLSTACSVSVKSMVFKARNSRAKAA